MELFYKVLAVIIGPVVGIIVYVIIEGKRNAKTKAIAANEAETMLDDISYIQEMKHLYGKVGFVLWQQYDILLASQHYGWETMVDWAAYMESADIENFERLTEENGSLSIAGYSRTLNDSVKIVWFNQTRMLRVFTHINDETLITKYVETFIRRTFGTTDAMKLAKPVPIS